MIAEAILAAKLGHERKDAQVETCTVFAAALFDVLRRRGIHCELVTAVASGIQPWAHSVVKVGASYFDSMGAFSADIVHKRLKLHRSVKLVLDYQPDSRDELVEPEYAELYEFLVKKLSKSFERVSAPA